VKLAHTHINLLAQVPISVDGARLAHHGVASATKLGLCDGDECNGEIGMAMNAMVKTVAIFMRNMCGVHA
jgi:hypothetical protein